MKSGRLVLNDSGRRAAGRVLTATVVVSTLLAMLTSVPAEAFKPYTHVVAAQPALADVVDDGRVTIDGREYAVSPAVVQALRDWPSYYQAGVIGPDGFPDLTFGQSTIHPGTDRQVDRVPDDRGLGGAVGPDLQHRRAWSDPCLHLRFRHPRRR